MNNQTVKLLSKTAAKKLETKNAELIEENLRRGQQLRAAWAMIENLFEIEPRAEWEKRYPGQGLEMAIHAISGKRNTVELAEAESENRALWAYLKAAPHGPDCTEGQPEGFRAGKIVLRAACNCWKSILPHHPNCMVTCTINGEKQDCDCKSM